MVNWLRERNFFTPSLEHTFADDELLSAFDVDYIRPEAMLWQTEYLTLKERVIEGDFMAYYLQVPNKEVRSALNRSLLNVWFPDASSAMQIGLELRRAMAYVSL